MDATERAALDECKEGRLEAFDVLYTRHVDSVYRYLLRRTFIREIAEDLTSTTFLKALESIRSFDPSKGELRAWLYRIARNSLIDHYRDPSHKYAIDIETVFDLPGDEVTNLRVEKSINAEAIHKMLQTLSPDQREIVLLRVWEGLSYKEIAELTGKTENNCKVIFSRTLTELRKNSPSLLLLLLFPRFL